jgi:hypothetical protein
VRVSVWGTLNTSHFSSRRLFQGHEFCSWYRRPIIGDAAVGCVYGPAMLISPLSTQPDPGWGDLAGSREVDPPGPSRSLGSFQTRGYRPLSPDQAIHQSQTLIDGWLPSGRGSVSKEEWPGYLLGCDWALTGVRLCLTALIHPPSTQRSGPSSHPGSNQRETCGIENVKFLFGSAADEKNIISIF